MKDPLDRAVRAIARRNSYALVWAQFGLAHVVVFGGLGLLSLYQQMSSADFWLLVGISQALVIIDNLISIKLTRRMWRPVWAWERGARDTASTIAAWLRNGGHANKFIGDGLLGVFGAPDHISDHADRAVRAALEVAELVRESYGGQVGVGIGVNSGSVVSGTVGGGGRVEFTGIGDTVNTAARVEAATRETGDDVLITESTRERLCSDVLDFEERPPVPLKGKSVAVRLWVPRVAVQPDTGLLAERAPVPE